LKGDLYDEAVKKAKIELEKLILKVQEEKREVDILYSIHTWLTIEIL